MRNVEELRELGLDELRIRLGDAEEELANLKFQLGSHQLESPIKVRIKRREVARMKTIIRQKEIQAASDAAVEAKE